MLFNQDKPRVIHLDINSCFATIEQQANPKIRNKPVIVCAYVTNSGCILASSVTAKKLGIKTGMRVIEAKRIYPKVIVLPADPPKYRFVHQQIKTILSDYSPNVIPKSIDEFVFRLEDIFDVHETCLLIKERIKKEVGEYITVSIGVSVNRYLAKVASNLKKPDGLEVIDSKNFLNVFSKLSLFDLTGIKNKNAARLKRIGIDTVLDFFNSPIWKLRIAFSGISGLYWYLRLHGYEIDDFKTKRRTIGNSYAPPLDQKDMGLKILSKLSEKTGQRLRELNLKAVGVHLFIQDRNGASWHMGKKTEEEIFASGDIFKKISELFKANPIKADIRNIAITLFDLSPKDNLQLELFSDVDKKEKLSKSLDAINLKHGDYTIYPSRMANSSNMVKDRIAFGR